MGDQPIIYRLRSKELALARAKLMVLLEARRAKVEARGAYGLEALVYPDLLMGSEPVRPMEDWGNKVVGWHGNMFISNRKLQGVLK